MFEDHSLIHDLLQSLLESSRDIAVRKSLWHSISAIASNNLNLVVREIIKTISTRKILNEHQEILLRMLRCSITTFGVDSLTNENIELVLNFSLRECSLLSNADSSDILKRNLIDTIVFICSKKVDFSQPIILSHFQKIISEFELFLKSEQSTIVDKDMLLSKHQIGLQFILRLLARISLLSPVFILQIRHECLNILLKVISSFRSSLDDTTMCLFFQSLCGLAKSLQTPDARYILPTELRTLHPHALLNDSEASLLVQNVVNELDIIFNNCRNQTKPPSYSNPLILFGLEAVGFSSILIKHFNDDSDDDDEGATVSNNNDMTELLVTKLLGKYFLTLSLASPHASQPANPSLAQLPREMMAAPSGSYPMPRPVYRGLMKLLSSLTSGSNARGDFDKVPTEAVFGIAKHLVAMLELNLMSLCESYDNGLSDEKYISNCLREGGGKSHHNTPANLKGNQRIAGDTKKMYDEALNIENKHNITHLQRSLNSALSTVLCKTPQELRDEFFNLNNNNSSPAQGITNSCAVEAACLTFPFGHDLHLPFNSTNLNSTGEFKKCLATSSWRSKIRHHLEDMSLGMFIPGAGKRIWSVDDAMIGIQLTSPDLQGLNGRNLNECVAKSCPSSCDGSDSEDGELKTKDPGSSASLLSDMDALIQTMTKKGIYSSKLLQNLEPQRTEKTAVGLLLEETRLLCPPLPLTKLTSTKTSTNELDEDFDGGEHDEFDVNGESLTGYRSCDPFADENDSSDHLSETESKHASPFFKQKKVKVTLPPAEPYFSQYTPENEQKVLKSVCERRKAFLFALESRRDILMCLSYLCLIQCPNDTGASILVRYILDERLKLKDNFARAANCDVLAMLLDSRSLIEFLLPIEDLVVICSELAAMRLTFGTLIPSSKAVTMPTKQQIFLSSMYINVCRAFLANHICLKQALHIDSIGLDLNKNETNGMKKITLEEEEQQQQQLYSSVPSNIPTTLKENVGNILLALLQPGIQIPPSLSCLVKTQSKNLSSKSLLNDCVIPQSCLVALKSHSILSFLTLIDSPQTVGYILPVLFDVFFRQEVTQARLLLPPLAVALLTLNNQHRAKNLLSIPLHPSTTPASPFRDFVSIVSRVIWCAHACQPFEMASHVRSSMHILSCLASHLILASTASSRGAVSLAKLPRLISSRVSVQMGLAWSENRKPSSTFGVLGSALHETLLLFGPAECSTLSSEIVEFCLSEARDLIHHLSSTSSGASSVNVHKDGSFGPYFFKSGFGTLYSSDSTAVEFLDEEGINIRNAILMGCFSSAGHALRVQSPLYISDSIRRVFEDSNLKLDTSALRVAYSLFIACACSSPSNTSAVLDCTHDILISDLANRKASALQSFFFRSSSVQIADELRSTLYAAIGTGCWMASVFSPRDDSALVEVVRKYSTDLLEAVETKETEGGEIWSGISWGIFGLSHAVKYWQNNNLPGGIIDEIGPSLLDNIMKRGQKKTSEDKNVLSIVDHEMFLHHMKRLNTMEGEGGVTDEVNWHSIRSVLKAQTISDALRGDDSGKSTFFNSGLLCLNRTYVPKSLRKILISPPLLSNLSKNVSENQSYFHQNVCAINSACDLDVHLMLKALSWCSLVVRPELSPEAISNSSIDYVDHYDTPDHAKSGILEEERDYNDLHSPYNNVDEIDFSSSEEDDDDEDDDDDESCREQRKKQKKKEDTIDKIRLLSNRSASAIFLLSTKQTIRLFDAAILILSGRDWPSCDLTRVDNQKVSIQEQFQKESKNLLKSNIDKNALNVNEADDAPVSCTFDFESANPIVLDNSSQLLSLLSLSALLSSLPSPSQDALTLASKTYFNDDLNDSSQTPFNFLLSMRYESVLNLVQHVVNNGITSLANFFPLPSPSFQPLTSSLVYSRSSSANVSTICHITQWIVHLNVVKISATLAGSHSHHSSPLLRDAAKLKSSLLLDALLSLNRSLTSSFPSWKSMHQLAIARSLNLMDISACPSLKWFAGVFIANIIPAIVNSISLQNIHLSYGDTNIFVCNNEGDNGEDGLSVSNSSLIHKNNCDGLRLLGSAIGISVVYSYHLHPSVSTISRKLLAMLLHVFSPTRITALLLNSSSFINVDPHTSINELLRTVFIPHACPDLISGLIEVLSGIIAFPDAARNEFIQQTNFNSSSSNNSNNTNSSSASSPNSLRANVWITPQSTSTYSQQHQPAVLSPTGNNFSSNSGNLMGPNHFILSKPYTRIIASSVIPFLPLPPVNASSNSSHDKFHSSLALNSDHKLIAAPTLLAAGYFLHGLCVSRSSHLSHAQALVVAESLLANMRNFQTNYNTCTNNGTPVDDGRSISIACMLNGFVELSNLHFDACVTALVRAGPQLTPHLKQVLSSMCSNRQIVTRLVIALVDIITNVVPGTRKVPNRVVLSSTTILSYCLNEPLGMSSAHCLSGLSGILVVTALSRLRTALEGCHTPTSDGCMYCLQPEIVRNPSIEAARKFVLAAFSVAAPSLHHSVALLLDLSFDKWTKNFEFFSKSAIQAKQQEAFGASAEAMKNGTNGSKSGNSNANNSSIGSSSNVHASASTANTVKSAHDLVDDIDTFTILPTPVGLPSNDSWISPVAFDASDDLGVANDIDGVIRQLTVAYFSVACANHTNNLNKKIRNNDENKGNQNLSTCQPIQQFIESVLIFCSRAPSSSNDSQRTAGLAMAAGVLAFISEVLLEKEDVWYTPPSSSSVSSSTISSPVSLDTAVVEKLIQLGKDLENLRIPDIVKALLDAGLDNTLGCRSNALIGLRSCIHILPILDSMTTMHNVLKSMKMARNGCVSNELNNELETQSSSSAHSNNSPSQPIIDANISSSTAAILGPKNNYLLDWIVELLQLGLSESAPLAKCSVLECLAMLLADGGYRWRMSRRSKNVRSFVSSIVNSCSIGVLCGDPSPFVRVAALRVLFFISTQKNDIQNNFLKHKSATNIGESQNKHEVGSKNFISPLPLPKHGEVSNPIKFENEDDDFNLNNNFFQHMPLSFFTALNSRNPWRSSSPSNASGVPVTFSDFKNIPTFEMGSRATFTTQNANNDMYVLPSPSSQGPLTTSRSVSMAGQLNNSDSFINKINSSSRFEDGANGADKIKNKRFQASNKELQKMSSLLLDRGADNLKDSDNTNMLKNGSTQPIEAFSRRRFSIFNKIVPTTFTRMVNIGAICGLSNIATTVAHPVDVDDGNLPFLDTKYKNSLKDNSNLYINMSTNEMLILLQKHNNNIYGENEESLHDHPIKNSTDVIPGSTIVLSLLVALGRTGDISGRARFAACLAVCACLSCLLSSNSQLCGKVVERILSLVHATLLQPVKSTSSSYRAQMDANSIAVTSKLVFSSLLENKNFLSSQCWLHVAAPLSSVFDASPASSHSLLRVLPGDNSISTSTVPLTTKDDPKSSIDSLLPPNVVPSRDNLETWASMRSSNLAEKMDPSISTSEAWGSQINLDSVDAFIPFGALTTSSSSAVEELMQRISFAVFVLRVCVPCASTVTDRADAAAVRVAERRWNPIWPAWGVEDCVGHNVGRFLASTNAVVTAARLLVASSALVVDFTEKDKILMQTELHGKVNAEGGISVENVRKAGHLIECLKRSRSLATLWLGESMEDAEGNLAAIVKFSATLAIRSASATPTVEL